ncbi:S-layer homology domain-containing protein [Cohnella panacarvi]|uniref:S-layer homology domain-containing protein n=1 Tax=Cohnella panacarvi TaxID=400776 RepID=UPI00047AC96D|nr:S-layer homology domain-containing protein [Cohnella panacarvi]
MKKLIALLILVPILFNSDSTFAASSNGEKPSAWAKDTVAEAIAHKLVPERLQSKYQSPITRDEFAEMLVQTVIQNANDDDSLLADWSIDSFLERVDVDVAFEDTQADYIKVAFAIGAINGVSDTKFAPDALITRQEAATMLINTLSFSNGTAYNENEIMSIYKDYSKIAKWAQPAVQNAYFRDILLGVGDYFDYAGKFTREQAIATMWRLYYSVNYDHLTLRGIARIEPDYINNHFTVGKDYIYMDYPDEDFWMEAGDAMAYDIQVSCWDYFTESNQYGEMPSLAQGVAAYRFTTLRTHSVPEVIKAAAENKSITVDFGYMTYTTLTKDHVIEMRLKPVKGNFTILAGHTYGYPKQEVVRKVIKIEDAAYESY